MARDEQLDSWLVEQAFAGRTCVVQYEHAQHIDHRGRHVEHRYAFACACANAFVGAGGSPYRATFDDAVPAPGVDAVRDLQGKVLVVPARYDDPATGKPRYSSTIVSRPPRDHRLMVGRLKKKGGHRRGPG